MQSRNLIYSFRMTVNRPKFSIFTELIGVTLATKLTQVSGVQFWNTPICHTVCSLSPVWSPPIPCGPFHPVPPPRTSHPVWWSRNCVCVYKGCCFFHLNHLFHPDPSPSLWQLPVCSLCLWVHFCVVCRLTLSIRFHMWVKSHGACPSLTLASPTWSGHGSFVRVSGRPRVLRVWCTSSGSVHQRAFA